MNKFFITVLLVILSVGFAAAQSRDESSPTPVTGSTIRATLIDNSADSYQIYYYSMNLPAGNYRARLRAGTRECNGANVSVYVDGIANVSTASCESNISTGELDFDLETSGNHVIAIYVTGGTNERFEVELTFSGRGGYVVGSGKETGVTITPAGKDPKPSGVVVTAPETDKDPDSGGITVTAPDAETKVTRTVPVNPAKPDKKPAEGKSCVYESDFSVSNSNLRFFQQHGSIVVKRGTARIVMTAVNNEGSVLYGAVQAEQAEGSRIFPIGAFGGRLRTPMSKKLIKEQAISGNGTINLSVFFAQNRTSSVKNGSYKLVVAGDAIVSCGTDEPGIRRATPVEP